MDKDDLRQKINMTYSSKWVKIYKRDRPKWPKYVETKTAEEEVFAWKRKIPASDNVARGNRQKLIAYYQKFAPAKVGSIDKLLAKYQPTALNGALKHKYGTTPGLVDGSGKPT